MDKILHGAIRGLGDPTAPDAALRRVDECAGKFLPMEDPPAMTDLDEAVRAFMRDNPSVTNPALILHGILEARPDLREGMEIVQAVHLSTSTTVHP